MRKQLSAWPGSPKKALDLRSATGSLTELARWLGDEESGFRYNLSTFDWAEVVIGYQDRPVAFYATQEDELLALYVSRQHRRQGYARALISHCLRSRQEAGHLGVWGQCIDERAEKVVRACGFTVSRRDCGAPRLVEYALSPPRFIEPCGHRLTFLFHEDYPDGPVLRQDSVAARYVASKGLCLRRRVTWLRLPWRDTYLEVRDSEGHRLACDEAKYLGEVSGAWAYLDTIVP